MNLATRFLGLATLLFLINAACLSAQDKVVKGYYMYWSKSTLPASQVPWDDLTHLAYAFIWPDANGNLVTSQAEHPEMIQRAHDEGVLPIISVGGWGQSDAFPAIAADSVLRARFIGNLVDYVVSKGYGGIDLDWEYPAAGDRDNLTVLVRELREALDELPDAYELSMAMPSVDWRNGYNVFALNQYVDWFGLMTYDFHGSWTNRAGHNSPLFAPSNSQCNTGSIHQSVQHYRQKGLPRNKIVVGLASYGRQFNAGVLCGVVSSTTGNGAAVPYHEAMRRIDNGWTREWDPVSQGVYLLNPDSTRIVTFDDSTTFRLKADYIVDNELRGAMVWALGYDRIDARHPLMHELGTLHNRTVSVAESTELPASVELLPNYPNPFNPVTTLSYRLSEAGTVQLAVYDPLGRELAVLVNGNRPAGLHSVRFDAGQLAGGVYFYKLRFNGETLTGKMMLMK
ncbi:MAG: chitinase [Bacteroidetes bacterium HLUCCA01]|nr:MAG: chitinase [Bacteroidetes bacterium HLUCCA01]